MKLYKKIKHIFLKWYIRYSIYSMNRQISKVEQALIQELKERGDINK